MSAKTPRHDLPFRRGAVVGLGVVGIPVAAKMAEAGIATVGLDVDEARVRAIREGRYPFASDEPGIAALLHEVHATGRLTATTDPKEAIAGADVVVVVVQTPVGPSGAPTYAHLQSALASVGKHLQRGALVVVESTLAPGTMKDVVLPALEKASGLKAGADFHLGHCPERVMPGRLLQNIVHYDRVVGGLDDASTKRMMALYPLWVKGRLTPTGMTTAEVVKTAENAYRDVQIAFANEVARISQAVGVDAWEVRELVNKVEDRHMLRPGVGVGGHCIPKDGLLLAHAARGRFDTPLLHAARAVNDAMPKATAGLTAAALGQATGVPPETALQGKRVTILGASYLPGADDTRDTPSLPLAKALEERGAMVAIADPFVRELDGRLVLADTAKAIEGADAVVLATAHEAYLRPDWIGWKRRMRTPVVVDGRGVWDPATARAAGFTYRGVGR